MYCPECLVDYRDGFSECSDCRVALVSGESAALSNRELRAKAASVVRRFRDSEITNDQFEDRFRSFRCLTNDRALSAIANAIWGTYSDTREHTLLDEGELPAELRLWFDRGALFLESQLPYLWERDTFVGLPPFSDLVRLAARTAKRIRGRTSDKAGLRAGPESDDDWNVWPFQSEDDFRRTVEQASER
jgi:hypothetical protein